MWLEFRRVLFRSDKEENGKTYPSRIGRTKLYDLVLESMIDYFLNNNAYKNSKKIIFDSETSRDKIVKTLDKLGVKELK